jgi:L-lactate dehydrogenase complex protein LldE
MAPHNIRRVGLFATCLVDLMRPSVGFAAVKLLEDQGLVVEVPTQSCCGQPAFNSGDRATTRAMALNVLEAFEGYDAIVVPSGSCGGMIKSHYMELVTDDPPLAQRMQALCDKTYELISFLHDVLGVWHVAAAYEGSVTYHDSCSGLRELGIHDQPRRLLNTVEGLSLVELPDADTCCGFGGTFCVKYSDISNAIVERKTASIVATGATTLAAGDLGCLMNMAGKLQRQGSSIKVRHVAEILAGMGDEPSIGEAAPQKGA